MVHREGVLRQKCANTVHDTLLHLMNNQLKEAVIYTPHVQLLVQRKVAGGEHTYRFTLQCFQDCSMGLNKTEKNYFFFSFIYLCTSYAFQIPGRDPPWKLLVQVTWLQWSAQAEITSDFFIKLFWLIMKLLLSSLAVHLAWKTKLCYLTIIKTPNWS